MATSAKTLDFGTIIDSGNTAYDNQAISNTAYQRTYQDIAATGINPVWALTNGAGTSAAASSNDSTEAAKQLGINQQNADSQATSAKAQMMTAEANKMNAETNRAKMVKDSVKDGLKALNPLKMIGSVLGLN